MKRAQTLLVSVLLAATALSATAEGAFAYRADVWSNSDSFSSRCLGFTDTYPQQLYYNAHSLMAWLGYSPRYGALGSGFTRSAFLGAVLPDWAVYVHSHGDNYWSGSVRDSAVWQDPGPNSCGSNSTDLIRSSAIKSATLGSPYNLVIMSTCYLGSSLSTMPEAFQIPKTKTNTSRTFYLGYAYSTYDSSALRFEQAFLSYLYGGGTTYRRSLYGAYLYATSIGGYEAPDASNPFWANWWGNSYYDGTPG